ncbi:LytTR family DNA-binding domain-containing protein [Chitinophaga horti]|uniref:LytTR family DNA-binding domain-containing protein n=1 Tax=Chitinophaga horti TaxID=2920382 RepID=A0ABY6J001_9BACT|nr:LytTR family DNA-binding domain-containing protein [Chitinophaga horti]UYQ91972.1 LytTR family DNA-binding domain-containing protein [Chitinophaga horti]
MMNILIIEDEPNAAQQLMKMIKACRPLFQFSPVIDSVEAAVQHLQHQHAPDLIFLDIHLSDGHAFDIVAHIDLPCPVIFTTAYDEYALKAFEVNSIDYLLKPIAPERVTKAITKFEQHYASRPRFQQLLPERGHYKQSFLVPFKDKLLPVRVSDFAWFEINNAVVSGVKFDGTVHILEERSLDALVKHIDPRQFYRANRQLIINKAALKEVAQYFNGKLLVKTLPQPREKIIISRDKVTQFKSWVTA